jgi:hypothetical protein
MAGADSGVLNTTRQVAGGVASYEDLWKFTLVNYNAGPGCLTDAIAATSGAGEALTWENVSARLTPACQGAIDYVDDISSLVIPPTRTPSPTRTPTRPRPSPTPTFTPIFVGPTATAKITPTP